jgi:hypothetical protein
LEEKEKHNFLHNGNVSNTTSQNQQRRLVGDDEVDDETDLRLRNNGLKQPQPHVSKLGNISCCSLKLSHSIVNFAFFFYSYVVS